MASTKVPLCTSASFSKKSAAHLQVSYCNMSSQPVRSAPTLSLSRSCLAAPRCLAPGLRTQYSGASPLKLMDLSRKKQSCSRSPSRQQRSTVQIRAAAGPNDGVKWWEKNDLENMTDIHSTDEFCHALSTAGEKLVIVEFYASWCGSCRALFPKFCKIAEANQDILFVKVNFDENKAMCKSLNIKVLPYFHFYRGAAGRLDDFSASISKLPRLREAIEKHSTDRCSLGPTIGAGELDLGRFNSADATAAAAAGR